MFLFLPGAKRPFFRVFLVTGLGMSEQKFFQIKIKIKGNYWHSR